MKRVLVFLMILLIFVTPAAALENKVLSSSNSEEVASKLNESSKYGKIIALSPLSIGAYTVDRYVQYENLDQSVALFFKHHSSVLDFLRSADELELFSTESFPSYYRAFMKFYDDETSLYYRNEDLYLEFVQF